MNILKILIYLFYLQKQTFFLSWYSIKLVILQIFRNFDDDNRKRLAGMSWVLKYVGPKFCFFFQKTSGIRWKNNMKFLSITMNLTNCWNAFSIYFKWHSSFFSFLNNFVQMLIMYQKLTGGSRKYVETGTSKSFFMRPT